MNKEKTIREYFDEFILYKHSLGYDYEDETRYLRKYISFAESSGYDELMGKEVIDKYLSTLEDVPGTLFLTACVLREFSRYLIKMGVKAYLIPNKTFRQPTPTPPYFFTDEEISRFFSCVDSVKPSKRYKGRELIFPAFFRLLYCCGLRCKEARLLRCENVVLKDKYLDILQSKGPKSRRIFISSELRDYLETYNEGISILYPKREYFFPGSVNPFISERACSENFRCFWDQAFPEFSGDHYPRAYDFRHHFAWANINKWNSEGMDVDVMLPYLMKYMGHQSIKSTLYYFHFVPDFYATYRDLADSTDDIFPEVPE